LYRSETLSSELKLPLGYTHDVNPCPSCGIVPSIATFDPDNQYDHNDGEHAAADDSSYRSTDMLELAHPEAPEARKELGVREDGEDDGVQCEG
jgi:hypothetical protein